MRAESADGERLPASAAEPMRALPRKKPAAAPITATNGATVQQRLERHWLEFLEQHGATYGFDLAREKARYALSQRDSEPIAAQALRNLNQLAALLERQQKALQADEVSQLTRACNYVTDLLALHTPTSTANGSAELRGEEDLAADQEEDQHPQSSSRHAARFRQQHASALNNRITRRRSAFGSDVPKPEEVSKMLERMGMDLPSATLDPADAGSRDRSPALNVSTPREDEPQASEAATKLRGPRRRAASFQSIRHSQRRSAGIDGHEINKALKAAEHALGLEPRNLAPPEGVDKDLHHSIYVE